MKRFQQDNDIYDRLRLKKQDSDDKEKFEPMIIRDHQDWIQSVHFSNDMKYFASGSHDKSIKLYCMQTKKLLTSFLHEKYVFSIAFTNDNKRLISGGGDKVIKIWDLEQLQLLSSMKAHENNIITLAISKDDKKLISGSTDKTLKIWNLFNQQCVKTILTHNDHLNFITFTPNNSKIISSSKDNSIHVWHGDQFKLLKSIYNLYNKGLNTDLLSVSQNDKIIALAGPKSSITLISLENLNFKDTIQNVSQTNVVSVLFCNTDQFLISGDSKGIVKIWNLYDKVCIQTMTGNSIIYSLSISSDDKNILAAGFGDSSLRLWNIQDLIQKYSSNQKFEYQF